MIGLLYAICPYCNKSIALKEDVPESKCVFCGQSLFVELLIEKEAYIDIQESNKEFNDAKLYFDNTDFRGALEHFEKSLKANPNNYLANYFSGLCAVYENESKEDFNVPLNLIKTLMGSIEKMDNMNVELKHKTEFLSAALNEIHIIILSQYKKMQDKYNIPGMRKVFRRRGMEFLRAINELHAIDAEKLLIFDKAIASTLVGITDVAIGAAFDISMPHLDGFNFIDILSDTEFNTLHGYFLNFTAYAQKLDPGYKVETSHSVDYGEAQQYSKDVLLLIDDYYSFNKENNKKHLSITGEMLDNLNSQCFTAVHFLYYTCVRNIGTVRSNNTRISLVTQAITIAYERLLPRLYIDINRNVNVVMGKLRDIYVFTEILDGLYDSLPENVKKIVHEVMDTFFKDVYNTVSLYFDIVVKNYSKVINKLKKAHNDEYRYYRDFLFNMTLCCSPALLSVMKAIGRKPKNRINLLKLCKRICEEFLLLCDYRIAAIEASPKYNDILKIYGAIDYDISYLSKIK